MAVGADNTGTATREALLRDRGYSDAVIHNGNGHHPEGDTPPPATVEELPASDPPEPALSCGLVDCVEPLPPGRRKYCSPGCADEAERRRIKAKAQREAEERAATRAARSPRPSAPAAKADPPPDLDEHQVDEHRRPGIVEVATQLLASGTVAEVEVEVDGATLVARAAR